MPNVDPNAIQTSARSVSIFFRDVFAGRGIALEAASVVATLLAGACLVLAAYIVFKVVNATVVRVAHALLKKGAARWGVLYGEERLISRLSHLAPALVVSTLNRAVFGGMTVAEKYVEGFVNLYLIAIAVGVVTAALDLLHVVAQRIDWLSTMPLKGMEQAVKLVVILVAGILALSVLFGESPVYFLSGIGALAAVLMLVFKDAILGFTGGIMLAANQMVRVGDWIEMPSAGADGDVVDVSLTTVKVQNWDKTIVTIPAYSLASGSFKNWRGMSESGGRRIKRAINIDMKTVRFADEKMLERWRRIDLLKAYLAAKQRQIDEENNRPGCDLTVPGNMRRLTNLGTFRAYCEAYLRAHASIHQGMTLIVRQLQPEELGVPLELYAFTSDIRWVQYEGIQSDIFDHLLAIIGEFDLAVYQNPSSEDVRGLGGRL